MHSTKNYKLLEEVASVEDFMHLREVAGLSPRPLFAAASALQNSLYAVQVRHESTVVGMGRIVGDGGLNFDVVDIAVAPEHQGFGLGRMILHLWRIFRPCMRSLDLLTPARQAKVCTIDGMGNSHGFD